MTPNQLIFMSVGRRAMTPADMARRIWLGHQHVRAARLVREWNDRHKIIEFEREIDWMRVQVDRMRVLFDARLEWTETKP